MSIFWWVLIVYLVWASAGTVWFITRLGHKNKKDTLLDKILIPAAMPIAYIMGTITFIRRKVGK